MQTISLKFSKSFLLEEFINYPAGGGIYFHYIKNTKDNTYRIIYVGECQSFELRQKEHLSYYGKNKYSLFEIEDGELNIKYIPDYDSSENIDEIKKKTISSVFTTCGIIENLGDNNTYKEVEGAIINHLYRKGESRKFLLNTNKKYTLRNTEIRLLNMDVKLFGLDDKIITP